MSRSVGTFGLMLLAALLLAVQVPVLAAAGEGVQAAPSAPVITVWYGNLQSFGTPGSPQRQINVLGNVSGASNLHFSLNGGPDVELAMGGGSAAALSGGTGPLQPDQGDDSVSVRGALGDLGPMAPDAALALLATASPRLASSGDFNIEIDTSDLNDGPNTVVIKANGGLVTETVTVNYAAGNTWPLPYSVDWDAVADIRDAVQVVDGQWARDGDNIRTMSTGYDRIAALDDMGWDRFQVTVPVTITQSGSVDVQVAASFDDAEEKVTGGEMALKSSDLELVEARAPQIVGLRFQNLSVPQGATITNAYVEFTADETHTGATDLTFHAQASDDAAAFASNDGNLTSRPKTAASAAWNTVAPWTTVHAVYRSTDLLAIVQEVVDRPGWAAGNALAIFVTGSGRRTAESYNGAAALAPRLHVSYVAGK